MIGLDRWVQMLQIKKKIRRKNQQLQLYKTQARRRLRALRRIRAELLANLRAVIDMKLNDTKAKSVAHARALMGRTLHMHLNWLHRCRELQRVQRKKLLRLRNKELALDERLRLLRKQLKVLPHRRWLVARCFRLFRRGLRPDGKQALIKEVAANWKKEGELIRMYLLDWNGKKKRPKHMHVELERISWFSKFWDREVLRKKAHKMKLKPPVQVELKVMDMTKGVEARRGRSEIGYIKRQSNLRLDAFAELPKIQRELYKVFKDGKETPRSEKMVKFSEFKTDQIKHHSVISLKDVLNANVDSKSKLNVSASRDNYGKSELKRFKAEMHNMDRNSKRNAARISLMSNRDSRIRKSLSKIHSRQSAILTRNIQKSMESTRRASQFLQRFSSLLSIAQAQTPHLASLPENNPVQTMTSLNQLVSSDVLELLRNKSVPAGIQQDVRNSQWQLLHALAETKKKKQAGEELMSALDAESNAKYRAIQSLLSDVIQGPSMLDVLADRSSIVSAVLKHYMWKNLSSVFQDLKSVGIPKMAIYKVLREQYLKYINEIVDEAVQKGAKLSVQQPLASESPPSRGDSIDSVDRDVLVQPRYTLNERYLTDLISKRNRANSISADDDSDLSQLSLDSLTCRQLKNMDEQYSLQNLQNIHNAHARHFNRAAKTPLQLALERRRQLAENMRQAQALDGKATSTHASRRRKQQQLLTSRQHKVNVERLYYAPRRTCRQRQADEDCAPCDCEPQEQQERCRRCGIELPALSPTPQPSSVQLSLSSSTLAACANNRQVLNLAADLCHACGFVHEPRKTRCPMLLGTGEDRLLQPLRQVEQFAVGICRAAVRRSCMCRVNCA